MKYIVQMSMFRLAPVAEPFWSRGRFEVLPKPPPPLGGGTSTLPRLLLPHPSFWQHAVSCLRHFGDPDNKCSGLP